MIDLRYKALPDTLIVQGRAFAIHTDFRIWLHVGELLKQDGKTLADFLFIFRNLESGEFPRCNFLSELVNFYNNPNSTPNMSHCDSTCTKIFDYIEDGEYIYASFMQVYNIDLLDVDMHWFKFKALFSGLPEDCKISKIMGYRSYKTPSKSSSMDSDRKKLRQIWGFPVELDDEDRAALDEFNNL